MAVAKQTMTDEQRRSVALEYLKAFDQGGTTSTGGSILDLFADDAQVYFPKWGLAEGKEQIGRMFGDVGAKYVSIKHAYADFNWIMTGHGSLRLRRDERRRARRRCLARGRHARRTVVRRLRGPGLPDPALLHLSRSRLRRSGHRPLPMALGGGPRRVDATGMRSFTYDALPGRVVFGVGSVDRLNEEVDRLHGLARHRVLRRVGQGRRVVSWWSGSGRGRSAEFTDIQQHVPIEVVETSA